jgi:superfamily II DNA/RNA helicase
VRALVRLLRRTQQPAIVFTEYRDTLETLATALSHHSPVLLHGGLTGSDRHASIRQFARGDAMLLLATDAASEGLNLHQHCRLVINLELPWTPVRLEQRIGRVERIGQTRRVHAIHLLAAGTAEVDAVARLLARTARVATALNELRPETVSESDVAAVAIGGSSPAQIINRPQRALTQWPERILVRDLRADANREAARLELARSMSADADLYESDLRPCVTTLTRRRGVRSYWIYRQSFVDRELRAMWETLAAISTRTPRFTRRSSDVRDSIAVTHAHLTQTIEREREHALVGVLVSSRGPLAVARQREEAIVASLVDGRARLSAALLQRGLFDRRNERAAAAQSAVVEEALARCRARIEELDRCEHVASEPATLAFALLRR